MSRLKEYYEKKIKNELLKKFGYKNPMMIPKLDKVVINMGCGDAAREKNMLQDHLKELACISGQKSVPARAKKAISNYKTREGMPIGVMVTLRGKRMFDFIDRFINLVSPRIRDFRGFGSKCDGRGNYTLGLDDQQIFPEVNLDEVKRTQGMNITFVTTANTDEECVELLRLLGMPFKKLPVQITV